MLASNQYQEKSASYFAGRRLEMTRFIPRDAQTLLDIGCGSAAFSQHLKSLRDIHITGIEAFPEAAAVAAAKMDCVYQGSVEHVIPQLADNSFDCVVMNDVLEHLVDPWAVLQSLHRVLKDEGHIVASIPNIRYFPVLKQYFIGGEWTYTDDGVMDRTHLRFFTRKSIADLFDSTNYRIIQLDGINPIKQFPWKFRLLNFVSGHSFDDARFKQFACLAQSKKSAIVPL